ncbi:hypothetical protein [Shouchella rhizosphaerae]|uniref:Phage tail protein n=1 Tax=Shouchella rhizosphaerae TaxID=866786 RepID=A0ABZ2CT31_9BACI
MAFNTKPLLTDSGGNLVPQTYNPLHDRWEVLTDVKVEYFKFQDSVTAPGVGEPFHVRDFKKMNIEIHGNSTSRLIRFMGSQGSGIRRPVMAARLSDLHLDTQTYGTGELWQIDLTGLNTLFIDVVEVTGGTVTVEGRAVV